MSEESEFEDFGGASSEIVDAVNAATAVAANGAIVASCVLPEKSRRQYEFAYTRFKDWMASKKVKSCTENVLLAYFYEKSKHLTSASLWSKYSMLRPTLAKKDNIDIRKFSKLTAFLKHKAVGYRSKKSKVFTREQFYRFLIEAPDERYLMMKVAAIFGIAGACRRDELQQMTVNDIQDNGSVLVIKVSQSKTHESRYFVVSGKSEVNMLDIYRKYASLRPSNVESNRFFISYRNGRCFSQVVGVNTLAKVPFEIAKYLCLPNPTQYTGRCFKRTPANLLMDTAEDMLALKQQGIWKPSTNSERYFGPNVEHKRNSITPDFEAMDIKESQEFTVPSDPFLPDEREAEEIEIRRNFPADGVAVKQENNTEDIRGDSATSTNNVSPGTFDPKETPSQLCSSDKSIENEYILFGKSVACQLQKLPEYLALQSMEFIQSYLVQRRLSILEEGMSNYNGRPISRLPQTNSNTH